MRRTVFEFFCNHIWTLREDWCVWHLHSWGCTDVPFLIIGYLKKEEVKGGQDSTSIKNVFCFETIKCLPSWLTPLFW